MAELGTRCVAGVLHSSGGVPPCEAYRSLVISHVTIRHQPLEIDLILFHASKCTQVEKNTEYSKTRLWIECHQDLNPQVSA